MTVFKTTLCLHASRFAMSSNVKVEAKQDTDVCYATEFRISLQLTGGFQENCRCFLSTHVEKEHDPKRGT